MDKNEPKKGSKKALDNLFHFNLNGTHTNQRRTYENIDRVWKDRKCPKQFKWDGYKTESRGNGKLQSIPVS